MKAAVIVFPGSNCDRDCAVALEARHRRSAGHGLARRQRRCPQVDLIVAAGRLLLRRLSALRRHGGAFAGHARGRGARRSAGTPVLGICNGFQVLTEAGLLPGALMRNASAQIRLPAT